MRDQTTQWPGFTPPRDSTKPPLHWPTFAPATTFELPYLQNSEQRQERPSKSLIPTRSNRKTLNFLSSHDPKRKNALVWETHSERVRALRCKEGALIDFILNVRASKKHLAISHDGSADLATTYSPMS